MAVPDSSNDPLVSTQWLADKLDAPDIRVVDASWHMPDINRDGRQEYLRGHIEGAVFFDIDEIADTDSPYPHMMPSPEKFTSRVQRLGLGDGLRLVIYDSLGVFSSARVWWMFRTMGHEDVVVLDGGLRKWHAEGRPLDDGLPVARERHFTVRRRADLIRDKTQIVRKLETRSAQIVDARPAGRFEGTMSEPRAGLRSGHMPGSLNLPYTTVLNPDGTLKDSAALADVFQAAGVDLRRPIVTTCGSGVSACIVALALARLGVWDVPVYDGAWCEWASDPHAAILP
ncbi:3-mercaptopyruvate sulfurtransferase [Candidatus Phycosocius spiralis]|uniref:Sulfurtransferase n=1 Tax=Candidatus Phycosocius spiralis TaxID=2815099 RepID=A0ABQ4PT67_9PROT|nr:3-mercaptopyruvate sulfurtransferase [Candidatus Phycosocius spiralis]GIU66206.1 sulfurtransferase [Candidatus Phycosocius spiralis]